MSKNEIPNRQELVEKIRHYLTHREERKQKARKARAFAKQHIYKQRIEKLLHLHSK